MNSFRKLVSNLPFSPNLINQLSFYYRRLKKEEFTRRLGLIITILALIVQTFAIIAPPSPSLAASGNDLIYGGVNGIGQILNLYDNDQQNFKDILTSFGISRTDLQNGHPANITYDDYGGNLYSMGRYPYGFKSEYSVRIDNGQTYYMRRLAEWGDATDTVWQFTSQGRTFMIMYHCGNLVSIGPSYPVPPAPPAPAPPPPPVITGSCTVSTDVANKSLQPGEQFKASFIVTNTGTQPWGVYYGPGTANAFVLGTTNPLDNSTFGKNREAIPGNRGSGYGPILDPGQTVSFSDNFTAPTKAGTYQFAWRVLQEGKIEQIGTTCATPISVQTPPPPVCQYNPSLAPTDKNCVAPCQYNTSILSNSSSCTPCPPSAQGPDTNCLVISKAVANTTQNIDNANGTTANAGDNLVYTLQAKNTGQQKQTGFVIQDNIGDILEYSDMIDMDGGNFNQQTGIISWPATDIQPGATISKTFSVRVKDPIPQTPQSVSNPGSYDLKMTNVYGNTVNVNLPASLPKATEQVVNSLPSTGAGTNVLIEGVLLVVVTYFYMRSRQLSKETNLIRQEFNYSGE